MQFSVYLSLWPGLCSFPSEFWPPLQHGKWLMTVQEKGCFWRRGDWKPEYLQEKSNKRIPHETPKICAIFRQLVTLSARSVFLSFWIYFGLLFIMENGRGERRKPEERSPHETPDRMTPSLLPAFLIWDELVSFACDWNKERARDFALIKRLEAMYWPDHDILP